MEETPIRKITEHFRKIKDPRIGNGTRPKLLDIAFREDLSRVWKDPTPENLAVLRHMAINMLKQEKTAKVGIHAKRLHAGWDEAYLLEVLSV